MRPSVGAIPYDGGVAFRTWAPFAQAVAVDGADSGWSESQHALVLEGNGWWSVDVAGARVGDRYRYAVTTASGTVVSRTDPRARLAQGSRGPGVVYDGEAYDWRSDRFTIPPWNELVVYELHIGTFTSAGGGRGTLASAVEELDHLRDLGVNAVGLMPVAEFGGQHSKGYNTMLPFAVETDYGGPDALKEFVREAHARGIAVIADVVYNHFGAADLEYSLWQFDGWHEDWDGGTGGGIFFYNDWRIRTPWQAPRPDFGRDEVRRYLVDNALMWLGEFRLDGLRVDQTAQMWSASGQDVPEGWWTLQALNNAVDDGQPWKIMIAEDFARGSAVTAPTDAGGAGFDAQWDPFVHAVRAALTPQWDDQRDLEAVAIALTRRDNPSAFARVIYTESHDEDGNGGRRLPAEISPGAADDLWAKKRSTLGAALVLTAPGVPMLFQGQEFLDDGWWDDDHMLDWSKRESRAGILRLYADLVRLRRNWFDTTRGLAGHGMNLHHLDRDGRVIAFHRWQHGGARDDVVVIANFSGEILRDHRVGVPRAGRWRVRFNSDYVGYDRGFDDVLGYDSDTDDISWDGMALSAQVGLGRYAVLVMSQDE